MAEEKLVLSVNETAERLNICPTQVRRMIKGKQLTHIRIGDRVLIPVNALAKWLEDKQIPPSAPTGSAG
jgi:excisionase family DNA binding protein